MRNPYLYYYIPEKLRDLLNWLIPGLIREPVPVRVRSEYPEHESGRGRRA